MRNYRTPEYRAKHRAWWKKRYAKQREEINAQRRLEYARDGWKTRTDNYVWWERARRRNYLHFVWKSAKDRAKKKGLPFTITEADIYIPLICPVLGIPLKRGIGNKKALPNSPSLDRIIPELGYVPGNVIVISYRANALKKDATIPELQKLATFFSTVTQEKVA